MQGTQPPRRSSRIMLTIPAEAFDALRDQARREYRTPQAEATRILLTALDAVRGSAAADRERRT